MQNIAPVIYIEHIKALALTELGRSL